MTPFRRVFLVAVFTSGLSACAPPSLHVAERMANEVESGAACEDFSQKMTASLGQVLIDQEELPTVEELTAQLKKNLATRPGGEKLAEELADIYNTLVNETQEQLGTVDRDELLGAIMGLEIGDRTTPEKEKLQDRLSALYSRAAKSARALGLQCPIAGGGDDKNAFSGPTPSRHHAVVKGALQVMATAYQSCQSLRVPAMSLSSVALESAAIRYLSPDHPAGGKRRVVGDLKALQRSHYYIREGVENGEGCFNVTQNPLIYDFGGKPFASASTSSTLNFFRNAGSGTAVLGTDCSGYVYAALVANGLRIKAGRASLPSEIMGVGARMFMDPVQNGLTCLAPVPSQKNGTIRNGDILASAGHVLIIDAVSDDPFGVNRLGTVKDCIQANISYRNFEFDVLQSSPSKNGVGINRMKAADYLEREGSSMKSGLHKYAISACKARFGVVETIKPSEARLVRHKMTSDCMNTPIRLDRESCVRSCIADL